MDVQDSVIPWERLVRCHPASPRPESCPARWRTGLDWDGNLSFLPEPTYPEVFYMACFLGKGEILTTCSYWRWSKNRRRQHKTEQAQVRVRVMDTH